MKFLVGFVLLLASVWVHASAFLVVRTAPGVDPKNIAARYQIALVDRTDPAPFVLFDVPPPISVQDVIASMAADPDVVWAEDDRSVEMPETSGGGKGSTIAVVGDLNALYLQNSNWLAQIHFEPPRTGFPRFRARVAILDTGISPYQPLLMQRIIASQNFVDPGRPANDLPFLFDTGDGSAEPGVGHGTMVAGIVAQLSPASLLINVRVADRFGNSTSWRIIKGLVYAVTVGAHIANISLGSPDQINALRDVCDWVEAHNVVVVSAIGNNGENMALHPAEISKVLCIAGVDPEDRKATFSNWDSSADACAPATGIKSFWWDGTLGIWSGTSFATPVVTGSIAAALTFRGSPASASAIRDAVRVSGADIDNLNPAFSGKLGTRVDYRALKQAIRNL